MHDLYQNGALDGAYFGRKSAWHQLGMVGDLDPVSAYSKLGISDEKAEVLVTASGAETPWSVITRTNKNGEIEFVSDPVALTWFWLSHAEAAGIAFQATGGAIAETVGVLGQSKGDVMFCTFPLRTVEIAGAEHRQYVFYLNSLRKFSASVLGVTDICMVCKNTVDLGLSRAKSIFRAPHRQTIVADTLAWFKEVWGTAMDRGDDIVKVANRMIDIPVTEKDMREALTMILPFRGEQKPTGMKSRDERIQKQREWSDARTAKAHGQIIDLFSGQGAGLENMKDDAWKGYQAIIEWADHYRPTDSLEMRAELALVGETARVKARAAKVLLNEAWRR